MAPWLMQAASFFVIAFAIPGVPNEETSACKDSDMVCAAVGSPNATEASETVDGLAPAGATALIQAAFSKSKLEQIGEEATVQTPDKIQTLEQIAEEAEGQTPADTASLDDTGYQSLVTVCCAAEISKFIRRVVESLGKKVCDVGGLEGLAKWYMGCEGYTARDYAALLSDIQAGTTGDCPWVGDANPAPGTCPPRPSCPTFADDRRRRCSTTVSCTKSTDFDLSDDCNGSNGGQGKMVVNNLGGDGPTGGKEEIRYRRVGLFANRPFDLVVRRLGNVTRGRSTDNDLGLSGCNGQFGKITIQAGTTVDLAFAFEDTATSASVVLPDFLFSVYDLDGGEVEQVEVPSATKYFLSSSLNIPTNVIDKGNNIFSACRTNVDCKYYPNVTYPCTFDRVTCPQNWPQPTSPTSLTDLQKAGAVQFEFLTPLSSFTLKWGANIGAKEWSARMFFAGASNLVTKCP